MSHMRPFFMFYMFKENAYTFVKTNRILSSFGIKQKEIKLSI